MRLGVILLVLVMGCDAVFRLDAVEPPPDAAVDAPIDAPADAPTILPCTGGQIILRPTGSFLENWTEQYPVDGVHRDKVVDDGGADDDASYIATAVDGQFDLFTHTPIASDVVIEWIAVSVRARLETNGVSAVELGTALSFNATPAWTDRSVTSEWADITGQPYFFNPVTTQPWTADDVNAMTFGVRKSYANHRVRVTQVWATINCQ